MQKRLLFAFTAILWLAAVTGFYFLTHKPFDLILARNLALAGWRIALAILILSVSGALGGRILPGSQGAPLFDRVTHAAVGLGLLGTGIFLVGATVGVSGWAFAGLLVGLLVWLRRDVLEWLKSWRALPELWHAGGRMGQIITWGVAFLFTLTLFTALAPPLKFDALVYHLTLPKIYLSTGHITYQPIIFWGMPQLMEMLFTWAMALGGTEAAPVLSWCIALLTVLGLVDWVTRHLAPRAGWVAAAALLGGFSVAVSPSWGYVDWLVMLFGLTTIILLHQWQMTENRTFLMCAGLVAGFAIGTKYTAGVVALGGVVFLMVHVGRQGWKNFLQNLLAFSPPVLLAALPWLLKNLLATGNPFYPLLFPAGAMNATRLTLYQNIPPLGDWRDAVLLPWQATMTGVEGAPGYSASIGPLLLAFGFLGFLAWRDKKAPVLSAAGVLALTGLVFWAVTGRVAALAIQTRLFLVIFPAIALLTGAGFVALTQIHLPNVRLGRVAGVLLLLVFGLNLLEVSTFSFNQGALPYFFGLTSADEYQSENLGMTFLAYQAVNALPEDSRTLMLWEPRSLSCIPRCIPDEIVDRWLADRAVYGSAEAILAAWREAGYTHLLVSHFGADFYRNDPASPYSPADWQTLDELLDSLPVQTDLNDVYTLYTLTP